MIEVELKAWADLPRAEERLRALGKTLSKTATKEDLYFCEPGADPRTCDPRRDRIVRVRLEGDAALVTAKRKKLERDIETSEEIEFEASSAEAVRALLDYMGYRPFLRKRKESRVYRWSDRVSVELNRIVDLGDFVELEALLPERSPEDTIGAARAELQEIARALGVADRIEGRLYTDLLRERGIGIG